MTRAKKKRSGSRSSFRRWQRSQPAWVNFVALVVGMICALVLLGFIYRLLWGTSESSTNEMQSGGKQEVILTHDQQLQSDDPNELILYLRKLKAQSVDNSGEFAEVLSRQNRLRETAERILQLDLTEEQRRESARSLLEAAFQRVAAYFKDDEYSDMLRESGELARLRDTAASWLDDKDASVRQIAYGCHLAGTVWAYTSDLKNRVATEEQREASRQKAYAELEKLLEPGQTDTAALVYTRLMWENLLDTDLEEAMKRIRVRRQAIEGTPQGPVEKMIANLYDLGVMNENNVRKWVRELDSGFRPEEREPEEVLANVLADPWMGEQALRTCHLIQMVYEQRDDRDSCRWILDNMDSAAENLQDPEVAAKARQNAKRGRQRMELIGENFDLDLVSDSGVRITNQRYQGMIVLIVFAEGAGKSIETLARLKELELPATVRVIVVWNDLKPDSEAYPFMSETTQWNFISEPDQSLARQYPVDYRPSNLLLDHRHRVARSNVGWQELEQAVKDLEAERMRDRENQ